jgi:hypothetical protein
MSCFSPPRAYQLDKGLPLVFLQEGQLVPGGAVLMRPDCGNCIGCRVKRACMMGTRLLHESTFYDDWLFVTLTYRPEDMPPDGGLHLRDFQLFAKRLRKRLPVDRKIKISYCGEYGPSTLRPHFHALIFGFWPSDAVPVVDRGEGVFDFESELLEDCWRKGFVQFRPGDLGAAQYVARHNLNKINGSWRNKVDESTGLRPYERVLDSGELVEVSPEMFHQSHGIGERWIQKYYQDVFPDGVLPVPAEMKIIDGVPRYYVDKLADIDPVLHEQYQEKVAEEARRLSDDGYFSNYRIEARRKVFLARKALFQLYDKVDYE